MRVDSTNGLRFYQVQLSKQIERSLEAHESTILQLPTGGGKTHIAAEFIRQKIAIGKRIWFICHRREIINQTGWVLSEMGIPFGIMRYGKSQSAKLAQIASVGHLGRREDLPPGPDYMIFDECHHMPAPTWAKLKRQYPKARSLGLTATPQRLDGRDLGQFFDDLIIGPDTRQLIEWGFLANYKLYAPTTPDLRGIATRFGDYGKHALAQRMAKSTVVGDVVSHYKRYAQGRKALLFAVSVSASKEVVQRFNDAGIKASHVSGTTSTKDRDRAIRHLADGQISVLSNVEVFTEGFDLPSIGAVILLRPTQSLALYRQMVGRGLRKDAGGDIVILDHAGLVYHHGLPDDYVHWSLERKAVVRRGRKGLRCCPECASIHEFAAECPECGYRYINSGERSIDEVFGNLVELRRKPGFISIPHFASIVKASPATIRDLLKKGLPSDGGLVPLSRAIEWMRKYGPETSPMYPPRFSKPGEYESQTDFGKRVGYSRIYKLIEKGLPHAGNGWIPVDAGIAWIEQYKANGGRRGYSTTRPPDETRDYEKTSAFAERVGLPKALIQIYKKKGLPTSDNGWVHIAGGLKWLANYNCQRKNAHQKEKDKAIERLASTLGVRYEYLERLVKIGMPIDKDGVLTEATVNWLKNRQSRVVRPAKGYANIKGFARIIRRSHKLVYIMLREGLPITPAGMIPIDKGIAFYKQRTPRRRGCQAPDAKK